MNERPFPFLWWGEREIRLAPVDVRTGAPSIEVVDVPMPTKVVATRSIEPPEYMYILPLTATFRRECWVIDGQHRWFYLQIGGCPPDAHSTGGSTEKA